MTTSFPTIVTIEGNIGSGKSTLLHRIQRDQSEFLKTHGIVLVQEPVDQWMRMVDPSDGESLFSKYYRDPKRYAFLFQVMVFDSMIQVMDQAIMDNPGCNMLLCERSVASSFEIFARMLVDDFTLSPLEFQVCEMMYRNPLYARYMPTRVLYLTTPPEVCMGRIQMRNRDSEDRITLEYLTTWEAYCNRWLSHTSATVVRMSDHGESVEPDAEFDVLSMILSCA
jgi:deoxyadenosine/deoxycytidine kinase